MYDMEALRELADRESIRQCLMRYARAIDRVDEELLRGVYWPDALDLHGSYNGPAEGFIAYVIPLLSGMEQSSHFLGNMLIEVAGYVARCETYFTAFHRLKSSTEASAEIELGGRYIDRLERRGKEWRIANRRVAFDWFREYLAPADWRAPPFGLDVRSHRHPDDPSYELFGKVLGHPAVVSKL
jgi:hypothetical protein